MALEPFATEDDLLVRCPDLDGMQGGRGAALLADAAAFIASRMKRAGVAIDADDEVQAANLKSVCVSMARRAASREGILAGTSQMTTTAGPYSETLAFSNPQGDLYMTSAERALLGLDRMRIGSMRAFGGDR